jgi:CBS domain-containing protein
MGAILGGTMRSPFTGMIFVLELTHDINILLPLLIAVTCAHATTVLLLKRSILTEIVARRGFHLTREYETDPLEILFTREIMGAEVVAIPSSLSHEEIAAAIGGERRGQSLFSVVDDDGRLIGVVTRWMLEQWAERKSEDGAASLAAVAQQPVTAFPDEPLSLVVNRMASTGLTSLPVIERADAKKLVGNITLTDMLKARRKHLEEEQRRERVLPLSIMVPAWLRASPAVPASGRLPTDHIDAGD